MLSRMHRNRKIWQKQLLLVKQLTNGDVSEITEPPGHAKVVVCGGGVMGASVAYHLAKLGWAADTILIEQGRIGGGTTWHSSGLIGTFKPSLAQVNLTKSS
ncbi:FAD dependent oxidoreductase, partial [Oryctes borbonicus]